LKYLLHASNNYALGLDLKEASDTGFE
jgi:hypothetical protein